MTLLGHIDSVPSACSSDKGMKEKKGNQAIIHGIFPGILWEGNAGGTGDVLSWPFHQSADAGSIRAVCLLGRRFSRLAMGLRPLDYHWF